MKKKKVSAIEIYLKDPSTANSFQDQIRQKLGTRFTVKNRVQQNALLYKILNSEKWAIFIILTFVLIIAIFNLVGSLTMLVIDKKQDIAILSSIGASPGLIRKIFFTEGMMISAAGCITGMLTGLLFCLLQQKYGMIKMSEENLITDAYPIGIQASDFLLVFFTVMGISLITSGISSRLSVKHLGQMKDVL
ncbi:ABC transporter permease [Arcticibacter sp. MXS-1]|uniref:ABC transporter permease n=1 Tax=Arcticibacter sp. MXS-1 TaxID=3341726 RepID=UPI0035A92386